MNSATLIFQRAIKTALSGNAEVVKLIDERVFDDIPDASLATFPYVTFGPAQETPEDADCFTTFECFQQIDIWSREPGFVQCKTISGAIIAALHNLDASQDGSDFTILLRFNNTARDPDGSTSHGVLSFSALIDF